jgi:GAF domain-containing protein
MTDYSPAADDPELRTLLREAVQRADAAEGSILLLTEDGRALRFVVCESPVAATLTGTVQPLDKGITGLAFMLQQPMVVNDTARDGSFDPTVQERTGVKTSSVMAVPLVSPQGEFGALTAVNSRRPGGFSGDDLARYSEAAGRITARLASLQLNLPAPNAGAFA